MVPEQNWLPLGFYVENQINFYFVQATDVLGFCFSQPELILHAILLHMQIWQPGSGRQSLSQGHIVRKWNSWNLHPELYDSKLYEPIRFGILPPGCVTLDKLLHLSELLFLHYKAQVKT